MNRWQIIQQNLQECNKITLKLTILILKVHNMNTNK